MEDTLMSEMVKRSVRIVIDKKGAHTMEALEGFEGASCIEKTKTLELILGGEEVGSGKTDNYYKDGDESPISINLGN